MSIHDDIQEMLPGYALGALETDEAARAEAHLASCTRCTLVLEEYRPVASALALTVPTVQPPHDLKARTIQRALARQEAHGARTPTVRSFARPQRSWLAPAFAGVALVIGTGRARLERLADRGAGPPSPGPARSDDCGRLRSRHSANRPWDREGAKRSRQDVRRSRFVRCRAGHSEYASAWQ